VASVQTIVGAGAGDQSSLGVTAAQEAFPHWQYFRSLEAEFEKSLEYVEFSEKNFATFSTAFVRILLSAASEVDVLMKQICSQSTLAKPPKNIDQYRTVVNQQFPNFHKMRVFVPRYGRVFQPWIDWGSNANPAWWRAYNDVKHERDKYYSSANLEAAANAVSGLFCTVLFFYRDALAAEKLHPMPVLMSTRHTLDSRQVVRFTLPEIND